MVSSNLCVMVVLVFRFIYEILWCGVMIECIECLVKFSMLLIMLCFLGWNMVLGMGWLVLCEVVLCVLDFVGVLWWLFSRFSIVLVVCLCSGWW